METRINCDVMNHLANCKQQGIARIDQTGDFCFALWTELRGNVHCGSIFLRTYNIFI